MNGLKKIAQALLRPENRQLFLVIAIIVIAVLLSRSFSSLRETPKSTAKPSQIPVLVQQVNAGQHRVTVTTTGRVTPRNTVRITPQVSGRLEWLNPAMYAGGYFQAGEVLFRIEPADYKNTVAREQAEVARAQTELALERAEGNAALAEWQALNPNIPVPDLVSRVPQIAQARAALASANARLAQAQLELSRTEYKLPFAGRVLTSSLELGDYLQATLAYGDIYNNDSLEIVVSLPRSDLAWLNKPSDNRASNPANNDASETRDSSNYNIDIVFEELNTGTSKTVPATLLRIGATLDDTTRFQEIVIKPPADVQLLPGMLAQVIITGPPLANTWQLPLSALQADNIFWQVDDDQRLRRLPADVIATQASTVIVHAPLPSAQIVTNPISSGIEGVGVRLLNDNSDIDNAGIDNSNNITNGIVNGIANDDLDKTQAVRPNSAVKPAVNNSDG
ncbi:MAG: efflux RND transporter periplasmic adaptor subunit [Porticoccaceae bacterium]